MRKIWRVKFRKQVRSVAAMIKTAAEAASAEAEKSQTVILALGELRKEVANPDRR